MTGPARAAAVSPARAVAYAVLRRVFEQDAWADRVLHAEAGRARLDARDRALATQLAYGAVQRAATLDHVIAAFARRPVDQLDPPLRAALRLGAFQLVFLDGIAAHAAVGEAVELAKADAPRGAGLVNAVLRRTAREGRALAAALPERTAAEAALRHSYPPWLAERWFEALGADDARALMEAGNRPAEAALRANALRTTAAALAAELPVATHPAGLLPEGLVLEGAFDAFGSPLWEQGAFMPQSRAAMAVGRILAPAAGERVLDLCAAPGGKTTHLAALMEGRGTVVAVEHHAGRRRGGGGDPHRGVPGVGRPVGRGFPWPSDSVLLVAVGAIFGLVGLLLAIPALRRFLGDKLGPIVRQARASVADLLTDPRRCAVMLSGSIGNSLLQLASLWFVLHAFGATVGIAVMGAVLFGGKALAGAAPTPGGLGAVEAALIGGLSGAGVDPAVATPAVLVFRLLTNWAVVVPGWFALRGAALPSGAVASGPGRRITAR